MASTKPAAATPITSARKSRATRSAERNAATAKTTETKTTTPPAAAAKPTPAPEPQPKIDLGARTVTVWTPIVTFPDGTTESCPHAKYGHENEKTTKSCITRMINSYRAEH
jgi:hypothetical protein